MPPDELPPMAPAGTAGAPSQPAIEVADVGRVYKVKPAKAGDPAQVVALDQVSLEVPQGELFGLLGPNGAGKTTLIKILVTLLLPSSGRARVAGYDVATEAPRVRERIAMVSGGEHSGYGLLTVREQLWMFSQFYGVPTAVAKARINELLEILGLTEAGDRRVSALSTGMRQKINLIRGLVAEPQVLFLDEPTVGLDVEAARDIRAYLERWMADKPERTLLLTTHYLHEADELCDRVAIIHRGKIVACDTPANLRARSTGESYFVVTTDSGVDGTLAQGLPGVRRVDARALEGSTELKLHLDEDAAIAGLVGRLAAGGHRIHSLRKVEPSLEDVFVQIVGQSIEDAEQAA